MSLLIEALKKEVAVEAKEIKVVAEDSKNLEEAVDPNRGDNELGRGEWVDDGPWSGDWGQGWGDYPPARPSEPSEKDKQG